MTRGIAIRDGLLIALGATVLGMAGVSQAWATDDGYENVFTSVLTAVGVMSPEKSPEIDYRERPPLVVPPKASLVKPEEPGAHRSAAWPADPDVLRRKREEADVHSPVTSLFNRSEDRPLSKDEQLKYRAEQEPVEPEDYGCTLNQKSMSHCRIDPDELKAEGERFKAANPEHTDKLTAGVEPDRLYLTQPPRGYLKPTKNVAATKEAPQPKRDDSSPLSTYIHPAESKTDPLN